MPIIAVTGNATDQVPLRRRPRPAGGLVVLTARDQDRKQCQSLGMNGFVSKPFHAAEVESELRRVLGALPRGAASSAAAPVSSLLSQVSRTGRDSPLAGAVSRNSPRMMPGRVLAAAAARSSPVGAFSRASGSDKARSQVPGAPDVS